MRLHVLVVEDDDAIAEPLLIGLRRHGYCVTRASRGEEALSSDALTDADLILLDLNLPDLDGYEVCRRLRATTDVPLIIVSARGDELDRVLGLNVGADDYVVKPFSFRELLARMEAVLRRTARAAVPTAEPDPSGGRVSVDHRARVVTVDGHVVGLTGKEFDLLAFLASEPGVVRTRREILEAVWQTQWHGSSRTVDVHVSSLRQKLGDPALIETVRGVGFRHPRL